MKPLYLNSVSVIKLSGNSFYFIFNLKTKLFKLFIFHLHSQSKNFKIISIYSLKFLSVGTLIIEKKIVLKPLGKFLCMHENGSIKQQKKTFVLLLRILFSLYNKHKNNYFHLTKNSKIKLL